MIKFDGLKFENLKFWNMNKIYLKFNILKSHYKFWKLSVKATFFENVYFSKNKDV